MESGSPTLAITGAKLTLAIIALFLVVTALALLGSDSYSTVGFVYYCVLPRGGVEAGFVAAPRVYYTFIHSVHKDIEVDVLNVSPGGFTPSLVYLREFGAGTPEKTVGEFDGFIVVEAAVKAAKPVIEVGSRSNTTVTIGAAGKWLSIETCSFIRLVPAAG